MKVIKILFCAVVACALVSCEVVENEELNDFIRTVKGNMIFVEGGEYLMGDYGVEHGPEGLPYDLNNNNKPLHRVQLASFFMAKFKIKNGEYGVYLASNKLSVRQDAAEDEEFMQVSIPPNNPAHIDWYEAENYCNWLADVTKLPFALPTEAQWEYAARSRGRFLMVATDDGTYKVTNDRATKDWRSGPRGINISTLRDREEFGDEMKWTTGIYSPLPVDRFPPNPLGLYSMSDNGFEWVSDWYDPDYYQYSPIQNPQGPDQPVYKGRDSNHQYAKVLRGIAYANPLWGGGVNVQRSYRSPDGYVQSFLSDGSFLNLSDKTARCVVNSEVSLE
ncbi:formylglycine-generating enzyme family protein [Pseudomonas sp. NPDC089395]|uniref:formylglycine-generating enzyme family protein n=1 Tax=Pseudomonas sp. NPDC089395 TaxID=3364460 RepID=UPI0037FED43A